MIFFAQSVLSQLLDLKRNKTLMPLCRYNEFQNLHKDYERTVEAFQTPSVSQWCNTNLGSVRHCIVAFEHCCSLHQEPEWRSRYSDSLRVRSFGDRTRVRARFPAPIQTGSESHPTSCTMRTGTYQGVKTAGAWRLPPTFI
jgi:hypothetical protein